MEAAAAIKKIEAATYWQDVFTKKSECKAEYRAYSLLLHPDRCKLKGTEEAFKKVTEFRDAIENSYEFKDDVGTVKYSDFSITIEPTPGNEALLQRSLEKYEKLINLKDSASLHFRKYLPAKAEFKDGKLTFINDMRVVSLNDLSMPLDHARWVLSRLLEFSAWLNEVGFVHAGINPTSIFIIPETHGIICTSFYHMQKIGTSLSGKTISANYVSWYPSYIFDKTSKPKADGSIDIELAKRTMVYLLGDKSGNGIVLKKNHEIGLINYLTSYKRENLKAYEEYVELIHNLYGKPSWREYVI